MTAPIKGVDTCQVASHREDTADIIDPRSSDSLVGRRMAVSFGIELRDSVGDGTVEVIRAGEGLVSEMMSLQVAPETLDVVVQLRGIFRQPLDREPVGALGEGRP